jgi:ACS family tartrate transporter-like MFS transporter
VVALFRSWGLMSEQDRVLAKCAWRLVPFLGLLYPVSYIDRANVGFAALTMNKDLGFSPAIYGFAASVLHILPRMPHGFRQKRKRS